MIRQAPFRRLNERLRVNNNLCHARKAERYLCAFADLRHKSYLALMKQRDLPRDG